MIKMDQIERIRKLVLVEGVSQREAYEAEGTCGLWGCARNTAVRLDTAAEFGVFQTRLVLQPRQQVKLVRGRRLDPSLGHVQGDSVYDCPKLGKTLLLRFIM